MAGIKIDEKYLQSIIDTSDDIFGDWTSRIEDIRSQFHAAKPFESVVIDNFLQPAYAEKIYQWFPTNYESWYCYENPIEVKYAFDNIDSLHPSIKDYFYHLSSPRVISLFSRLSGIEDLEYDEYLHGAGLHAHPRDGRLQVHLDYEKHPFSGKERRLNVILFLSKDWKDEWRGHNELWGTDLMTCVRKTPVRFNRAILFKTNDISYHGLSEKIQCPHNVYRKSLAYYYVSPMTERKAHHRRKATYFLIASKSYPKNMERLCSIRAERLITKRDVDELFPGWKRED